MRFPRLIPLFRANWRTLAAVLVVAVLAVLAALAPTDGPSDGIAGGPGSPDATNPSETTGASPSPGRTGASPGASSPGNNADDPSTPDGGPDGGMDGGTDGGAGPPPVIPPPGAGPDARDLTSDSQMLQGASSTQTATIHPSPGGLIFVWVAGLVGSEAGPSPVPSVSGAGLTFRLVNSVSKSEQSTRRLSLFTAPVSTKPSSGPLTINFGRSFGTSEWLWSVVQTSRVAMVQEAENSVGGFVDSYSVTFPSATSSGNIALAGFIIGQDDDAVASAPMKALAETVGRVPGATLFIEWTDRSVRSAECSWNKPGHSLALAVEAGG